MRNKALNAQFEAIDWIPYVHYEDVIKYLSKFSTSFTIDVLFTPRYDEEFHEIGKPRYVELSLYAPTAKGYPCYMRQYLGCLTSDHCTLLCEYLRKYPQKFRIFKED